MALSLLGGSRRARIIGIAVVQAILILYLGHLYLPSFTLNISLPVVTQPGNVNTGAPSHDTQEAGVAVDDGQYALGKVPPAPTYTPVVDGDNTWSYPDDSTPVGKAAPTSTADDEGNERKIWGFLDGGSMTEEEPAIPTAEGGCLGFESLQQMRPRPLSQGKRKFPYLRPPPECRTFKLPALEDVLTRMKDIVVDPDLFRLFENSYPNTLDTMVKWRGYANITDKETGETEVTDEELTYVITGDIDAMWLRDSASQVYSYVSLLEPSSDPDSLASLWRGLINAHARYIVISPYCHSFQPPVESGIPPTLNDAFSRNSPIPGYNPDLVFDCKWELDSLASFLQISAAYYERTGDLAFFAKYSWVAAVQAAVDASAAMRTGTYDNDGHVLPSAWTFTGWTDRGSETLTNNGLGNPVKENGMVRSAFRPSDDACIFQLLTPSNMMFAAYLEQASVIMEGLVDRNENATNLTTVMRDLAGGIRAGIERDAVVAHRQFGEIFAYEVDGYGGANLMDDANVPSLLALPLWNYTQGGTMLGSVKDYRLATAEENKKNAAQTEKVDYAKIYQNTRSFILSSGNPYYAKGPVLSAVGGPHIGPGKGWPMAAIVAALTAYDDLSGILASDERDAAVEAQLRMVLDSTDKKGVVHETVDAWNEEYWTRSWFGWANGLFGELILKIAEDEEKRGVARGKGLLGRSWQ